MSIASKLQAVRTYKESIRQAIAGKGTTIPEVTPLSDYASIIEGITTGAPVVKLPSPIAGGLDWVSEGYTKLKIKWHPTSDPTVATQRLIYKTGGLPEFPVVDPYVDLDRTVSNYDLGPVSSNTDYGVWIQTLDEDGNVQTCQNIQNSKILRVQNTSVGNLVEVLIPTVLHGLSYYAFHNPGTGQVYVSSAVSGTPGLYKLDMDTLEWSLIHATAYNMRGCVQDHDGTLFFIGSGSSFGLLQEINGVVTKVAIGYSLTHCMTNDEVTVFFEGNRWAWYWANGVLSAAIDLNPVSYNYLLKTDTGRIFIIRQYGNAAFEFTAAGVVQISSPNFGAVSGMVRASCHSYTTSSGVTFITMYGGSGTYIWSLVGNTLTEVYKYPIFSSSDYFIAFFETSSGEVFALHSTAGIYKFNGTTFILSKALSTTISSWVEGEPFFYEFPEGVFFTSRSVDATYKWSGSTWESVNPSGVTYFRSATLYRDQLGTLWATPMYGSSNTKVAFFNGTLFQLLDVGTTTHATISDEDEESIYFTLRKDFTNSVNELQFKIIKSTRTIVIFTGKYTGALVGFNVFNNFVNDTLYGVDTVYTVNGQYTATAPALANRGEYENNLYGTTFASPPATYHNFRQYGLLKSSSNYICFNR